MIKFKKYSKMVGTALLATYSFGLAPAFANGGKEGSGGKEGNGGSGEILFHGLAAQIDTWLEQQFNYGTLEEKLNLGDSGNYFSGEDIVKGYHQAVVSTPDVKFFKSRDLQKAVANKELGADLLLENPSRICVNHSMPNYIRCNSDLFEQTSGDVQFSIVFHEYLGIAGIEENHQGDIGSYSNYPVSKFLMRHAQPKLNVRYELVSDGTPSGDSNQTQFSKYKNLFYSSNQAMSISDLKDIRVGQIIGCKATFQNRPDSLLSMLLVKSATSCNDKPLLLLTSNYRSRGFEKFTQNHENTDSFVIAVRPEQVDNMFPYVDISSDYFEVRIRKTIYKNQEIYPIHILAPREERSVFGYCYKDYIENL